MGTDIHGWAEWKWRDSTAKNPWGGIAPVPYTRSYDVFAILANVRNDDRQYASYVDSIPLRGVPATISPELADSSDWHDHQGDMHNCTWYTLDELEHASHLWEQIQSDIVRMLWGYYIRYLRHWSDCWFNCDVRIVIGFDC